MAVSFEWHRGATAALAAAIRDLDERLAALELLAVGTVVSPTVVAATVSLPSAWVQDSIPGAAVATTVVVPTATVRGAASQSATAVAAPASMPAPDITAASVRLTPARIAVVAAVPAATVTVP